MKLAIVVLNYNTPSDTIECLKSLKNCPQPKNMILKTIVVDNGSTDDSVDLISKRYPEVKMIENIQNKGFAGGNNSGIRAALDENPTHILLLNPDTYVHKDFFKKLYTSAINNPKVGILSPLIYFAKGFEFKKRYKKNQLGKVIWYAGGKFDWDNILGPNDHVDEVDKGQFRKPMETDFATGACMLIRRNVIDEIGLLNENYFLYLEDVEFCHRARMKGWRIMFDPRPKIYHKVSQSSGIGSPLNDYFITRNRLILGMKYAKIRTKFALFREAIKKLLIGTPAQKKAVKDFFLLRRGKGSWLR